MTNLYKQLDEYTKREKQFFPPYLWQKWGCDPAEFSQAVVQLVERYPNAGVIEKLFYLDRPKEQYVYEVCDTKYQRGSYVPRQELPKWAFHHQKKDMHHSVFFHDKQWLEYVQRTKQVGGVRESQVGADFIYLELDRKNATDPIQKAIDDALEIYYQDHISNQTYLFYSGNNSIHIAVDSGLFGRPIGSQNVMCGRGKVFWQLAHKIAGDVRYRNGLVDVYHKPIKEVMSAYYNHFGYLPDKDKVRQQMENIDPALYNVNSLIRSPFSWHEKGGKQKTLIAPEDAFMRNLAIKDTQYPLGAKPHLLHWYYECLEPVSKPKRFAEVATNSSYICKMFAQHIEDFDEDLADHRGWINGLYSPFYEDSNPSVSVNIKTGMYKDFGNSDHSFSFLTFVARIYNISFNEAKQKIKKESL